VSTNDATATWSGYNHQGKVGLFVALQEMANLVSGIAPDAVTADLFAQWYIEFERSEDFDICTKPPCLDPAYLHSRHQVKAYPGKDGRKITDYREVLLNRSKVVATQGENKGKYTKYRGFIISIVDEQGSIIGEVVAAKRYIHLVQNVESWSDSGEDNTNEVHRYPYPVPEGENKPFCALSNSANMDSDSDLPLDSAVYEVIRSITGKNGSEVKLVWQSMQAALTAEIARCHNNKTGNRPKLTFRDIFNKFLQNNADLAQFVKDYQADVLRRRLINEWAHIQQRYDDGIGIDDAAKDRIDMWLGDLHKKNNIDLKEYIESFSPHRSLPLNDIQLSGLHTVICETIRQVVTLPKPEIHEYRRDGMPYSLTTIADDPIDYPDETLRREINAVVDISIDNPYKRCVIVTKSHNFDLFESQFTDQLEYNEASVPVKLGTIAGVCVENIKSYQPRRVISVANAVIELNEEDS
jgi:hypothetical protein